MKKKIPARSPYINYKYLYKRIKKYRGKMSQRDLADKLDFDYNYYGKIERGDRPMSLSLLAEICMILHVSLEDMLEGCLIHDDWSETPSNEDDTTEIGLWFQEQLKGQPPETINLVKSLCKTAIQQNNASIR